MQSLSPKRIFYNYKEGPIIAIDPLPYPIVHYPTAYGSIMAFQVNSSAPITLCSCFKPAVQNYLNIRFNLCNREDILSSDTNNLWDDSEFSWASIVSSNDLPLPIVEKLASQKLDNDVNVLGALVFKEGLCHECNGATPAYLFCRGYGSSFRENYGWYINKQSLEYGIYRDDLFIPECCPTEIVHLFDVSSKDRKNLWPNFSALRQLDKRLMLQKERVRQAIENIVRAKFGQKNIGDAWTTETMLFH
jgi:hypothetical protein